MNIVKRQRNTPMNVNTAKLTLSVFMAASLTACCTSKTQHSYSAATETTHGNHSADSIGLAYLQSVVFDKPYLEIIRHTPTDTVRVICRAEKATVTSRAKVKATSRAVDSVMLSTSVSETGITERVASQSKLPFGLKLLSVLLLPLLIVLSWRGIRSRR
ncbi:MAG: hypothetical protein K2J12_09460 [Muribaculaceae bacterium]|nr:hypothetical protein [Muribaculaceae bacterium]